MTHSRKLIRIAGGWQLTVFLNGELLLAVEYQCQKRPTAEAKADYEQALRNAGVAL